MPDEESQTALAIDERDRRVAIQSGIYSVTDGHMLGAYARKHFV